MGQGRRQASPETKARALRDIASAIRAGMTITDALFDWDPGSDDTLREAAAAVKRRMKLGGPVTSCLEPLEGAFGPDLTAFQVVLDLDLRLGGDVAAMLDSVASSIERCAGELGSARSHAAGARLSGRMIAGLPLAFLPLTPMSRAPIADPAGALMLLFGLSLAAAGLVWMGKLLPRPSPAMPPDLLVTSLLATALRAGTEIGAALRVIAAATPGVAGSELTRAGRRARLGETWGSALRRSEHPGLAALGDVLDHAMRFGEPAADALMRLEKARRAAVARDFEAQIRRAAVRMVIPLTLCVLPSFVLLALGPFLRGLAG
jgi:tight adherence protein B